MAASNRTIQEDGAAASVDLVEWYFEQGWADGLPVVGACPGADGVYIATGHAMMGFTLGPVTGRLISEMIVDGTPSIDIDLLSPYRFAPSRTAQPVEEFRVGSGEGGYVCSPPGDESEIVGALTG